jgi:hypothetical protein
MDNYFKVAFYGNVGKNEAIFFLIVKASIIIFLPFPGS